MTEMNARGLAVLELVCREMRVIPDLSGRIPRELTERYRNLDHLSHELGCWLGYNIVHGPEGES